MSWNTRWRHLELAAGCLPLLLRPAERDLLREMRQLCRQLPQTLKQPLPQAMSQLTPAAAEAGALPGEAATRRLADLAALLERRSPLGLCLRRSLIRYHYLRRLDLPVFVHFGARLTGDRAERDLTGHAWLTYDGRPYHEVEKNWQGFTVVFSWPPLAPDADGT